MPTNCTGSAAASMQRWVSNIQKTSNCKATIYIVAVIQGRKTACYS
jgi:hypothetical protein